MIDFPESERLSGQTDVLELACDPIDTVDIAVIGLDSVGVVALQRLSDIDGTRIKAIYDISSENITRAQNILQKKTLHAADSYTEKDGWRSICERADIDLVYIFTQTSLRSKTAVYAMDNGKHVATISPAALSLKECWELVNTAEINRRHLIMLEQNCYNPFEMTTLNMAQLGLFGEVLKVESSYINTPEGVGPAAQLLNIHRGDKVNYLISVEGSNNAILKTELKKIILLRNNSSPLSQIGRTYNINGTNATASNNSLSKTVQGDSLLKVFEHPIIREIGKTDVAYIMDYRLIYCLRNGLPLDMDVYDAAEWSAVEPLSKISAKHNGTPVKFPDFTRQSWNKIKGYKQYKNGK
jgi:hypothetical protein